MTNLKHQITQLESEIHQEKQALSSQFEELKTGLRSPVVLTTAIIGGVVLGFALGNKRTTGFLRDKIKKAPNLLKSGLKHLPTLLSLFTRL